MRPTRSAVRRGARALLPLQSPRRLLLVLLALLFTAPLAHAEGGAGGAWWNKEWPYRKQVTVDTTNKGVEIKSPIGRAPVLLRLHSGVFAFKDAQETGQDLRFIGPDGKTPLAYHIESFDPKAEIAAVWLDVPEYPVGAAKSFWMYYGDKTAPVAQDAAGSFDPNYVLVYHFDGAGTQAPKDRTAYASNAASAPGGVEEGGVVGHAARFTGQNGVAVPATPALAFKPGAGFTFSAWIKPDAPGANQALFVRRQGANAIVVGLDNGVPFAQTGAARASAPGAVARGQWTHLAAIADGKALTLLVGGRTVASVPAAAGEFTGPIALGSDVEGGAGLTPYVGAMDEVRVSKIARPPALIYADAASQGSQSKLVDFGADEKNSGVGFGLFGVIVKSVDATAWGVISVLMLMAAGGLYVIYVKVAYANRVDRANDRFLALFREHGDDPLSLIDPRLVDEAERRRLEPSPIYRLYRAGADELARRERNGFVVMRAEGMEVVRAMMDSTLVRENQRLSALLVVLTICISGGPFLGLLGTVIGVMITFAAIAQAGDVNVNAIAPGISAALLATVAGLFVAIPALFGYNYILLRNKNITANMQVFVGEFITRAFETYSDPVFAMAAE